MQVEAGQNAGWTVPAMTALHYPAGFPAPVDSVSRTGRVRRAPLWTTNESTRSAVHLRTRDPAGLCSDLSSAPPSPTTARWFPPNPARPRGRATARAAERAMLRAKARATNTTRYALTWRARQNRYLLVRRRNSAARAGSVAVAAR